jgi:tetratricopeptide (TPR) repeat protein
MMNAFRRMLGLKRKRRRTPLVMPPPPPPPPQRVRQKTAMMPLPPGQIQARASEPPVVVAVTADMEASHPGEIALLETEVVEAPGQGAEAVAPVQATFLNPAEQAEALVRDPRRRTGAMRAAARRKMAAGAAVTGRLVRRTFRVALFYGLPALVVATPFYLLAQEMRELGIEVEPISVPTALPERGLTADVVARHLADQIDLVRRATLADHTDRRPAELSARTPRFEPPAPRVSLQNLATVLRDLIGRPRRRMTADVVLLPDGRYSLRVYLNDAGQVARVDNFTADTIDEQLALAAPQVWRAVSPRLYAWWLVGHEDRPDALQAALIQLAREVTNDPQTSSTVAMLRARTMLRSGKPQEANALLADLTTRSADYSPGWAMRAMALAELRRGAEALEMMSRARTLDGGYAWSSKTAARLYLRLGRPDDALTEIRVARRLDPMDGDAMVIEVGTLLAIRRTEEALSAARAGAERAPTHPGMQDALANALSASNRPDLALAAVDRELATFPPTIGSLVLRARLLLTLGRFADALAAADLAVAHMPSAGAAVVVRAWAMLELGQAKESLAVFDELLRARPDLVTLVHGRSLALLALGRKIDALEGLEKTVLIQPDNKRAVADLARLKQSLN